MKITHYLTIFTFLIATNLSSQSDLQNFGSLTTINVISKKNKKVKGSPYIQKEFEPLTIEGFLNKNFKGRYNSYSDIFEISLNGTEKQLPPSFLKKVYFSDNKKTYIPYRINGKPSFFVLNFENEHFKLLTKESTEFIEAKKAKTGYENDTPPKYKRKKDEIFVLKKGNSKLVKVNTNKKKLLKSFGEKSNLIKKYIKKHKLKIKKEQDLIKIYEYFFNLK